MMASGPSSIVGWPVVKCGVGGGRSICSLTYLPGNDEVMAETRANGQAIEAVPELIAVVGELVSFVAIMHGRGPECVMPDEVTTPIGLPVKLGDIMRNAQALLERGALHFTAAKGSVGDAL